MDAWIVLPCSSHIHAVIKLRTTCDIIPIAMPTIESVPKHKWLEQQIIFCTKTAMLNTTTTKLYGQSHKTGINYFNCIWLVFNASLSRWGLRERIRARATCNATLIDTPSFEPKIFAHSEQQRWKKKHTKKNFTEENYVRLLICACLPIEFKIKKNYVCYACTMHFVIAKTVEMGLLF